MDKGLVWPFIQHANTLKQQAHFKGFGGTATGIAQTLQRKRCAGGQFSAKKLKRYRSFGRASKRL
jgi:hypothetical protein